MKLLGSISKIVLEPASSLLFVGALSMGIRSLDRYESWVMTPRSAPAPAENAQWKKAYDAWLVQSRIRSAQPGMFDNAVWVLDRRIISCRGYLVFLTQYRPPERGLPNVDATPGYHAFPMSVATWQALLSKTQAPGEHGWSMIGIRYNDRTAAMRMTPVTSFRRPMRLIPTLTPGVREVAVSWWWIAAAAGVIPFRWCMKWWKQRRAVAKQKFCAACGYDLRATPDRCPECGVIPAKIRASAQTDPLRYDVPEAG